MSDNTPNGIPETDIRTGSLDGYTDQSAAQDEIDGQAYEDLLDEGFSTPDRETDAEKFNNERETIDDRLAEEEPDTDPTSGYGRQDGGSGAAGQDTTRAGRLVAPDEGLSEDTESTMIGADDGWAGGAGSAEEAAVHYVDDEGFETEPEPDDDI